MGNACDCDCNKEQTYDIDMMRTRYRASNQYKKIFEDDDIIIEKTEMIVVDESSTDSLEVFYKI